MIPICCYLFRIFSFHWKSYDQSSYFSQTKPKIRTTFTQAQILCLSSGSSRAFLLGIIAFYIYIL